jgi:hypothetical protein
LRQPDPVFSREALAIAVLLLLRRLSAASSLASRDFTISSPRRAMMVVMNYLRGQRLSAIQRMLQGADHEQQAKVQQFALDFDLPELAKLFQTLKRVRNARGWRPLTPPHSRLA